MDPSALSNEIINQIGNEYLRKFPQSKHKLVRLFQGHDHHEQARKMANYTEDSTAEEKWNFLLSIYKTFDKPQGHLAGEIDKYFISAFNIKKVPKDNVSDGGHLFYSTHLVVTILDEYVKRHFHRFIELKKVAPLESKQTVSP